jgi:hypothetical protein
MKNITLLGAAFFVLVVVTAVLYMDQQSVQTTNESLSNESG